MAVPLSFYAVRQAQDTVHPVAISSDGLHIDGDRRLAACLVAVSVLFVALSLELIRDTERPQTLRAALEEAS